LELILVMVIICTVLALAAPSLRGFFASRRTSEAAAQMLALTQLARTVAVSDGVVCRLNVDAQEHTYWLTVQREGVFQSPGTEYGRRFSLPEGTDVALLDPADESPAEYVEFNPNGRISPAIIRLTDQQGSIIEITCPSATESFAVTAVAGR
jgi:type II secretory pathway pseudopilin PulG